MRVHSECLTGDVFGSGFCQCGRTLDAAMRRIVHEHDGVLVYLRGHEGRGLGVSHTLAGAGVRRSGDRPVDAARQPGVRRRRPDPRRPRRHEDAPDDEQPRPLRRPRGVRPGDRRARRPRHRGGRRRAADMAEDVRDAAAPEPVLDGTGRARRHRGRQVQQPHHAAPARRRTARARGDRRRGRRRQRDVGARRVRDPARRPAPRRHARRSGVPRLRDPGRDGPLRARRRPGGRRDHARRPGHGHGPSCSAC